MIYFLTALLGAFLWTFAEYALHNWVGHWGKGKNEFSREHLAHHADTTYFAPLWKKSILAAFLVPAIWFVANLLVASPIAWTFAGSFVASFMVYEMLHRRIHTHAPLNRYGRWMRRHHLHHHFRRPNMNHGVTTPIWDMLFGTYQPVEAVRLPRRHHLAWVVDDNGEVRPEFAEEYRVAGRKPAPQAA